jgi:diguanylate cyclase (GGDEF)-like protein/PAS domain S-box-containing protein
MAGGVALRRDGVLRALVVLAAFVIALYAAQVGSVAFRVQTFWVTQVVLDIAFVVLAWRVARALGERPQARRFWRQVTVGGFFYTIGDVSQTVLTIRRPDLSAVAGEDKQAIAVLVGAGITVFAMATFPIQLRGRRERLKWWLDAATVLVAVAGYVWVFFATRPAGATAVPLGVLLLSAALSLIAAFGLMRLLIGGNAPFTAAAGIAAGLTSILLAASTAFTTVPRTEAGFTALALFRLLPCMLLAATPRIQEVQLRADPDVLRHRRRPYSRLPYVALAATLVLLVVVLAQDAVDRRVWGVVAALIVGNALVVGRQLVAFADNARLLSSLDQSSRERRREEERSRALVQQASDITIVIDVDGCLSYVSPATSRVLGRPPEDFRGHRARTFVHPEDRRTMDDMTRTLLRAPNTPVTSDLRIRHRDGSWRWIEVIGTNLLDDPNVEGIIGNLRDVTEARHFGQRLRHEATHDPLTGLANRALFDERTRVDPGSGRTADEQVAILTIDLDNFKAINDTRGHAVGDGLLKLVSQRLLGCVRPDDTVARVGGDEFVILLPAATQATGKGLADRILRVLSEPFLVDGNRLRVRASIGIAAGARENADTLLRASDASMYAAKKGAKGRYVVGDR